MRTMREMVGVTVVELDCSARLARAVIIARSLTSGGRSQSKEVRWIATEHRGAKGKPTVGVEPTTSALRKPCSAIELRRHAVRQLRQTLGRLEIFAGGIKPVGEKSYRATQSTSRANSRCAKIHNRLRHMPKRP